MEFYLDEWNLGGRDERREDEEFHLEFFRKSVQGCVQTGRVKHLVVIHTPRTSDGATFAAVLDEETAGGTRLPFTYVYPKRSLEDGLACDDLETVKSYTFMDGIQGDIDIDSFTLKNNYAASSGYKPGDWWSEEEMNRRTSAEIASTTREDIAALVVESLMSLDWEKSRIMAVSTREKLAVKEDPRNFRYDQQWCKNSNILARKLAAVE